MSTKTIDTVLHRWFHDNQFRQLLQQNPDQALAGYELSPAHRVRLSNVRKYGLPTPDLIPAYHKNAISLHY